MPRVLLDYTALRSDAYRLLAVDEAWLRRALQPAVTAATDAQHTARKRTRSSAATDCRADDADDSRNTTHKATLQLVMRECDGRLVAYNTCDTLTVRRIEYFHTQLIVQQRRQQQQQQGCYEGSARAAAASTRDAAADEDNRNNNSFSKTVADGDVLVLAAVTRTFDLQPTRRRGDAVAAPLLLLSSLPSTHAHNQDTQVTANTSACVHHRHHHYVTLDELVAHDTWACDSDGVDTSTTRAATQQKHVTADKADDAGSESRSDNSRRHGGARTRAAWTQPLRFRQWASLCACSPRDVAAALTREGAVVHRGRVRLLPPALLREVLRAIVAYVHTTSLTTTTTTTTTMTTMTTGEVTASCDGSAAMRSSTMRDDDGAGDDDAMPSSVAVTATAAATAVAAHDGAADTSWQLLETHLCPTAYPRVVVRAVRRCYGGDDASDNSGNNTTTRCADGAPHETAETSRRRAGEGGVARSLLWCGVLAAHDTVVGLAGYVFDTHTAAVTRTLSCAVCGASHGRAAAPRDGDGRGGSAWGGRDGGSSNGNSRTCAHAVMTEAVSLPLDVFDAAWRAQMPPSLLTQALRYAKDKDTVTNMPPPPPLQQQVHTAARTTQSRHVPTDTPDTTTTSTATMMGRLCLLAGHVFCQWADAGRTAQRATVWWLPQRSLVADVAARVAVLLGLGTLPCDAQQMHAYITPLLDSGDDVERVMARHAKVLRQPGRPLQYAALR